MFQKLKANKAGKKAKTAAAENVESLETAENEEGTEGLETSGNEAGEESLGVAETAEMADVAEVTDTIVKTKAIGKKGKKKGKKDKKTINKEIIAKKLLEIINAEGNDKGNKKGFPIHFRFIASKIIVSFGVAVALMAICMLFFAARVSSFNSQYEEVLDNLKKINYIRENSEGQARRFNTLCMQQVNIEESGEDVILQTMNEYLDDVSESIDDSEAYADNRARIETMRKDLDSYTEIVEELFASGDGTKYPKLDTNTKILVESTHQYNGNIASVALDLLVLELNRSADIQEEISSNYRVMILIAAVIFILTIAISIVLCLALTRSIVGPINKLKKEIMLVADGDLSRDALVIQSKDETRALTNAFNAMSENLKNIMHHVSVVADELEDSSKIVSQSIIENERGSDGVVEAIEHMTEQMDAQSAESESTMNQIHEMNNVSERIRESLDQINDNAVISMEQASDGTELIEQYSSQLAQVNEVMSQVAKVANALTGSTQEMNVILRSITEISSQTRLLSLNASIEAARAGDAGRGFAVVATEIGNLANDTQVATSKITDIINTVQNNVLNMTTSMDIGLEQLQKSNSMAGQTKDSFRQIADTTGVVSASIEEITSEMALLTDLVEKVVVSMEHMDKSIDANKDSTYDISALVTEQNANLNNISTSAQTLTKQSADLHELLSQFKLV